MARTLGTRGGALDGGGHVDHARGADPDRAAQRAAAAVEAHIPPLRGSDAFVLQPQRVFAAGQDGRALLLVGIRGLLRPWRLTFPRYEGLMLLYYSRNGSLPLGKMGARLQVHPTSVTNIIDGLERLEYVQRRRHERDRRTTMASITVEGREAAEGATAAPHQRSEE